MKNVFLFKNTVLHVQVDQKYTMALSVKASTVSIYRTGRFIGEDFILAIGDLFNFSPIFKTPTKYIRYDTLVHPDVIRQSKIRQML